MTMIITLLSIILHFIFISWAQKYGNRTTIHRSIEVVWFLCWNLIQSVRALAFNRVCWNFQVCWGVFGKNKKVSAVHAKDCGWKFEFWIDDACWKIGARFLQIFQVSEWTLSNLRTPLAAISIHSHRFSSTRKVERRTPKHSHLIV